MSDQPMVPGNPEYDPEGPDFSQYTDTLIEATADQLLAQLDEDEPDLAANEELNDEYLADLMNEPLPFALGPNPFQQQGGGAAADPLFQPIPWEQLQMPAWDDFEGEEINPVIEETMVNILYGGHEGPPAA